LKHEQIVGFLVEKGKNNEAEIENQNIKLKIARESEMENKTKYINMKVKVSKLSNASIEDGKVVASLTESNTNYERELRVLEAKVSGLEARGQVGGSPRINESQLREQVNLQEILQQTSQNELEICKNRIKVFEDEKDADQRLIKGLERGAATMKKELQRLNKADVQYQSLLDIHHGGSLRKYQNFMKTTDLSIECPDVVVERWRKINSYRYDECTMVLLTKLIISERVLKSKALLMDYLKSTLDFEPNDDKYHGNLRAPVKKEKENSNLLMMTPEKVPRRRKGSQNPSAYQDAYRRHLLYADVTNRTDIYADPSLFPDLWEEGHGRTEPEYARLDMSLFDTYKTEMNSMAKVVRSTAGGYLSMSNNLSQRRLCYMHQLTVIKLCEIPQCSRWLFPTTHNEAEMIGKVHWISGDYTQMLTQDLKVRPFGIL
jgi:hypothetical protein